MTDRVQPPQSASHSRTILAQACMEPLYLTHVDAQHRANPPVKRRLFTLLSALSLLAFVAVVVLWIRSYSVQDHFDWTGKRASAALGSLPGYLYLATSNTGSAHVGAEAGWHYARIPLDDELRAWAAEDAPRISGGGFRVRREQSTGRQGRTVWSTSVAVSYWAFALVTSVCPAWFAVRWLIDQRRRGLTHLCPSCGYDLRASPDRCPECGASPAKATA